MNRGHEYPQDAGDDGDGQDAEDAQDQATDGLEIALPDNAETYRLLMGEDPEDNPKVEAFRSAYDEAMAGGDGDHDACMEAGRAALENSGEGESEPPASRGGAMPMSRMGKSPLNMGA